MLTDVFIDKRNVEKANNFTYLDTSFSNINQLNRDLKYLIERTLTALNLFEQNLLEGFP